MIRMIKLPSKDCLSECLDYDPLSGVLRWKERPLHHFRTHTTMSIRNAKFAGKVAGTITRKGYLTVHLDGRKYQAHRMAWKIHYGQDPNETIDHINGDPADNRISNLRDCSNQENCRNRMPPKSNKSGVSGVIFHHKARKWYANIHDGTGLKHLGAYDTKIDAIRARLFAEDALGYLNRNVKWDDVGRYIPERSVNGNFYEHDGKKMCVTDWARELDIPFSLLFSRLSSGWSFQDAISKPNLNTTPGFKSIFETKLSSANTSGTKGVSWDKSRNKWMAFIKVDGKFRNIGRFVERREAEDAIMAEKERLRRNYSMRIANG